MWFLRPTGWPKSAWHVEQLKKASVLSLTRLPIILVALAGAVVESLGGTTNPSSASGGTADGAVEFSEPVGTGFGSMGDVLGEV